MTDKQHQKTLQDLRQREAEWRAEIAVIHQRLYLLDNKLPTPAELDRATWEAIRYSPLEHERLQLLDIVIWQAEIAGWIVVNDFSIPIDGGPPKGKDLLEDLTLGTVFFFGQVADEAIDFKAKRLGVKLDSRFENEAAARWSRWIEFLEGLEDNPARDKKTGSKKESPIKLPAGSLDPAELTNEQKVACWQEWQAAKAEGVDYLTWTRGRFTIKPGLPRDKPAVASSTLHNWRYLANRV